MITITAALVAEHKLFCAMFDHIEQVLPKLNMPGEVKRLARLVEGLLVSHAAAEEDLALLALDRVQKHKRRSARMFQEHQEIDHRLARVYATDAVGPARRLLEAAMVASRKHFRHEERIVFPLVELTTKPETLTKLGMAWMRRRHLPVNWAV